MLGGDAFGESQRDIGGSIVISGWQSLVSQPLRVQPFVVFLLPPSLGLLLPPLESVVAPRLGGGPLLHHLAKFPVGCTAILNHISGGDVTLDSVSPLNSPSFTLSETVPDFNLDFNLDEALKFVGLNCSKTGEPVWKPSEPEPTSDNKESPGKEEEDNEDSLDTLNDTLDDMIQAS
ncbi:hypothetical protein O3P69_020230 [Scylla paramamosain]|uniref:Uncharacterized protein n=1 Tax=Scylla paramamosain TaxID=85552 RepID=A0AAW0TKI7_SCYPA